MNASGSLRLAKIVGAVAVDYSFQKVSAEIAQKGPHFLAKTPNFKQR